ncbi:MAG: hypothetical protein IT479_02890 [Xanthomonadales bacterium]|nr:hypothetical protein [Xanthomonadales bacterium]MCC6592197.1 hypothetical protein [Xanthomonadales bacterium]MCE7932661.1 hypothetical protein [Xanthomonadales bacterium PRO6]
MATWIFVLFGAQVLLVALLARRPLWRGLALATLPSIAVVGWLWQATGGARSNSEAWLALTALPLVALGVLAWKQALGKLALGLGVLMTLALLAAWRWASRSGVDAVDAVILYAGLVLVAMVALFMIAGVLGMRALVARSRERDQVR